MGTDAGFAAPGLRRADCLRLLAGTVVGRVVFTDAALPAAHPVVYLLDGEEVVFRTASGDGLVVATVARVVAFQADELDLAARSGWSVLGIGRAYEVTDPARLDELATRAQVTDPRARTVAVPLHRLTGRWLRGAAFG